MSADFSRLLLLVEGDDDRRFFDTVVAPLLEGRYDSVKVVPWAEEERQFSHFSATTAKRKNSSFAYFCRKHDL